MSTIFMTEPPKLVSFNVLVFYTMDDDPRFFCDRQDGWA